MTKGLLVASTLAATLIGWQSPSQAQSPREAEIIGYHQLCSSGDRRACVRFGMLIEQNRIMQVEWRRTHPEFFWWEK
jgi:hypothetical protein